MIDESIFFRLMFRAPACALAFLGLGSHSRIIQAAEKSLGMAILAVQF